MAVNINASQQEPEARAAGHEIRESRQTTCCIVGGGPAGAVLSLLLARKGIPVMLLEAHKDFERDFRGDSVHPSTMEVMAELGIAERLLKIPHSRVSQMTVKTAAGPVQVADLSKLKSRYPFIVMMPQARFLDFVTDEAKRFPNFELVMSANVSELIEENGEVRGVRYRGPEGWHEVRAALTVGADGRFSKLRKLAGFEPIQTSPPMDILWLRLPRRPDDPQGGMGRFGKGHLLVNFERGDYWQLGYLIAKGGYQALHAQGIEALREAIAAIEPDFADRVQDIKDWKGVTLLSVEANRLPRWYKPGLLLIGDAAHVMSPVGGNGINYAIMDAVAAGNILSKPLKDGTLSVKDLAAVQRRRGWAIRIIQGLVTQLQKRVISTVLSSNEPLKVPGIIRWPLFGNLIGRLLGYGIGSQHVEN